MKLNQYRIAVAAAAASWVIMGSASAQPTTKTERTQTVDVKVRETKKAKPVVKQASDKPAGPSITADQILAAQDKVGTLRRDQLALLTELIKDTPDGDPSKPELIFQLGELYSRLATFNRLRWNEMEIKADGAKGSDQAKFRKEAAAFKEQYKKDLTDAVKVFAAMIKNPKYKNFKQMDRALFYLADTLKGAGDMEKAREILQKLIMEYPTSPFVPEAFLAFGDYYFEKGEMENAGKFYDKVLEFKSSKVWTYAKYKTGWVFLNQKKDAEAGEVFLEVVEKTNGDKSKALLHKAAKKDFVVAYSKFGKTELAFKTFERMDKAYAFDGLKLLADLYMTDGAGKKAIYTFRELIGMAPRDPMVCIWQYNVTRAMLTEGNRGQQVEELEKLVKLYGVAKSSKLLPADELGECRDNAASFSLEMATGWHSEYKKTLSTDSLQYADKTYKVYLEVFKDADDFAMTEFYYADLLWLRAVNEGNPRLKAELWGRSGEAFASVFANSCSGGKTSLDGDQCEDAAWAQIEAYSNSKTADPRSTTTRGDTGFKIGKVETIPTADQKILDAAERYTKFVKKPKPGQMAKTLFLQAETYARFGHWDKALPLFKKMLVDHRSHETAVFAANISLVYYEDAKEFEQGTALCDELGKDKAFLERDEYVKQRCDRMVYVGLNDRAKKCELAAEKSGNFDQYVECGNLFRDVYDADPEAKEADKLLWNAGIQYEKGKAIGLAIAAFSQLHKDFLGKKSEWAQKAIRKMGENYAAIAWYEKASEQYELYAQKYAGEADAKAALNDAVFFRKGIGDDAKAIENTNDYAKRFGAKNPKEAASAFFSIYSIYEKQGNKDKVISHLREYIGKWGSKGTTDLTVIAYGKIGDIHWNDSCGIPTVDGTCAKVERSRALAPSKKKKKKKGVQKERCEETGAADITIVARDPRRIKEAVAAFNQAISAFERVGGKTGGDEALARFYYARAKIVLADIEYEKSLQLKFPTVVMATAADAPKATATIAKWMKDRGAAQDKAVKQYLDALGTKDPFNAIAAVARLAQMKLSISDAVFTAKIPALIQRGGEDTVDIYCDYMSDQAEQLGLVQLATKELSACLEKSREFGFFNQWSAICERELGQLEPSKYQTASEVRATSNNVAPVVAGEAAVLRL